MKIIYKTTNLITGKIYIGQDSKNNSKYLGSGKYLWNAIKKHGKENFKKEIICECSSNEELNEKEKYWIKTLNCKVPNGYNLTNGGEGTIGYIFTDKDKKKIREKRIGFKHSEETKEKMRIKATGRKYSEEFKRRNGELKKGNKNFLGRKHTKESIEKISTAHKNMKQTEEQKKKNSESNKGKIPWNKNLKYTRESRKAKKETKND